MSTTSLIPSILASDISRLPLSFTIPSIFVCRTLFPTLRVLYVIGSTSALSSFTHESNHAPGIAVSNLRGVLSTIVFTFSSILLSLSSLPALLLSMSNVSILLFLAKDTVIALFASIRA